MSTQPSQAQSYAAPVDRKTGRTKTPTTARPKMKKPKANQLRSLSQDPNKAMQEMMDTIDTLRAVYDREAEALRSGDVEGFMEIQEEKLFNAYQYQADMQDMLGRVDELKERGQPEIIDALREKYDAFASSSEKNVEALQRMDRIMGRISERLINAAKHAAMSDSVTYSANGAMQGKASQVVTTGVSETA